MTTASSGSKAWQGRNSSEDRLVSQMPIVSRRLGGFPLQFQELLDLSKDQTGFGNEAMGYQWDING
jgi:hypothetical protein